VRWNTARRNGIAIIGGAIAIIIKAIARLSHWHSRAAAITPHPCRCASLRAKRTLADVAARSTRADGGNDTLAPLVRASVAVLVAHGLITHFAAVGVAGRAAVIAIHLVGNKAAWSIAGSHRRRPVAETIVIGVAIEHRHGKAVVDDTVAIIIDAITYLIRGCACLNASTVRGHASSRTTRLTAPHKPQSANAG
jgi:hypothetical protein